MNVSTTVRRHPVAALVAAIFVLVLTIGGALIGAGRTEPSYQSDGIMLIIPPGAGSDVATNNPFVNLDQNLSQLAQAISTRMSAPDVVTDLKQRAPSVTDYTAAVRYDNAVVNSMPTSQVQFTVTGTNAQVVRDAVRQLMVEADDALKQMQVHSGVTARTLADSVQLVAPTEPTRMPVSGARAAGMWAIAGLLLSLAILAAVGAALRFFATRDATEADTTEADTTESETAVLETAEDQ